MPFPIRVLLVAWIYLLSLTPKATDAANLTHETLFDPKRLVDVKIAMDPQDWTALRAQTRALGMALRKPSLPTPFTYFKANVTIDGHLIESVGIRKKGFVGSLDQRFPSLKLKFNEYVAQEPIDGLRRLTLNNNKQDATVISQFMANRMFAEAKLPAPRCNFAALTVNEQYLGIYSNVESIDTRFLKRQFGSKEGKLYEGTLADFFVDRIDDFESKVGDNENRDELRRLAEVLQQEPCDVEELAQQLDVNQFLRFWALESLINSWDGYTNNQNNYYLYHNPADSRFHFIPWGMDATFSLQPFIGSKSKSVHTKAILARRLFEAEGMADRYRETMLELLDSDWNEEALLTEIDRLEELLKEHVHPRQEHFTRAIDQTRKFIKVRRNQLMYELDRWPVHLTGQPLRPTLTKSVGSVTGTFSARWLNETPTSAYDVGEAELTMVLDGEPVEFTKLGVYGEIKDDKGDATRTILFVGKRKSNRLRIKLRIGMSDARFRSANHERPIVVQGNLEEGGFGLFGLLSTQGVRLVGGTLTVTNDHNVDDDAVAGSIELDVLRFVEDK